MRMKAEKLFKRVDGRLAALLIDRWPRLFGSTKSVLKVPPPSQAMSAIWFAIYYGLNLNEKYAIRENGFGVQPSPLFRQPQHASSHFLRIALGLFGGARGGSHFIALHRGRPGDG
jgi:hypothetical protein